MHTQNDVQGDFHVGETHEKLIPNLRDKQKYILHYQNLKLNLSLGMVLKKIHRVLNFKQATWLKEYIDFNTIQRAAARNDFEKDFFRLMNNSMFGKTMENLRNRRKIDLTSRKESFRKIVSQPIFKSYTAFHEDLVAVAVERIKSELIAPFTLVFPFWICQKC